MSETLSIRDNRTGRDFEIPITDGTIRAADLKQIAVEGEPGLATYDPGFVNTASCRSSVTYIDGDAGILEYRGYPIEQLAESSTYLEVAYLLLNGELPTEAELEEWVHQITIHTFLHENVKQLMQGYRYDAHPMGMLMSSVPSGPGSSTPAGVGSEMVSSSAGCEEVWSRAASVVDTSVMRTI